MDWIQPYIGQISFGGIAGFATGYALNKVGKFVAVAFGIIFVVVQVLASMGYISVDWTRIQRDVEPLFQQEQLRGAWERLVAVLTTNLPFGGAFVAGLILGLRRG
ncbi:FUN14 domain-containing protein [Calidithermus timidus]|uniref:FUN14 domain-containing protein n=1 Tax=Calidithermus timidus TaxID=307124 RepID=UPI0003751471|nr:FUN14 domain-containing protein [Calidithermus timidus]